MIYKDFMKQLNIKQFYFLFFFHLSRRRDNHQTHITQFPLLLKIKKKKKKTIDSIMKDWNKQREHL